MRTLPGEPALNLSCCQLVSLSPSAAPIDAAPGDFACSLRLSSPQSSLAL